MTTSKERHLFIVGAGGHGRVVADCARETGIWTDIKFLDARWPNISSNGSWPVVGDVSALEAMGTSDHDFFVAIGAAATRAGVLLKLVEANRRVATIVHPAATVSAGASLGAGTVVVAGAVVNFGVQTGRGCIINTASSVDHDCTLGDVVHICPGAHLAGTVRVGNNTWVGIGAVVRQNLQIGSNVTVGAGAVVVTDLDDGVVAVGTPARPRTVEAERC